MKDLRVTIRLSNNRLRERREKIGLTQKQMEQSTGVALYSTLENMGTSPVMSTTVCAEEGCITRAHLCRKHDQRGRPARRGPMRWKPSASKLAEFFGTTCEELFPDVVLSLRERVIEARIDGEEIAALLGDDLPTLEDHVEHRELTETVHRALSHVLSPREEKVLRLRFGINEEGADHSGGEVSEMFDLSRARISQIERKALRKLLGPLKKFQDGDR